MNQRCRVLYVEPAGHMGGSVASLLRLLAKLNRDIYEPLVLLWRPSELVKQFQAIGVPVICLYAQPEDRRAAAENLIIKRDIAAALERGSRRAAEAYRDAKAFLDLGRRNLGEAVSIYQVLRQHAIDLVHLNNRLLNTRSAALAAVLRGTPCVCHVRYYDPLYLPDRWLASRLNHHIFISQAVADDTRRRLPSLPGTLVYDGVALPPPVSAERRRQLRDELGLRETDFVVANAGRIVGWKGQDVLLRALPRLTTRFPQLQTLIIGDIDPPEDMPFFRQLEALILELKLSGRVRFTGHCENVTELMQVCDLIVHTATTPEPFGLVVLEAMAAGRPVVASSGGGVLDMITDSENGLLTPIRDEAALANALERLLLDRAFAETLGQRARERVAEHFTLERFVQGVESVYQSVLRQTQAAIGPQFAANGDRVLVDHG